MKMTAIDEDMPENKENEVYPIDEIPENTSDKDNNVNKDVEEQQKRKQLVHSLSNLPNTINGVALGCAGTAVMLRNVGHMYNLQKEIKWPFYIFVTWAAILMTVYLIKVILYSTDTIKTDFVTPLTIARSGVFCMSWCLIGSVLPSDLIGFSDTVAQVIIIFGEAVQLIAMSFFFSVCYRTSTLPEPFFNAAVLSIIFPALTLPGQGALEVGIRHACFSTGIIFFMIFVPIEVYRTTAHNNWVPVVAKDQSVAMLQSGAASICSAWHISPLTGSATVGLGGHIGHIVFGMSTVLLFITLFAIYQRRLILYDLGPNNPGWSACSFPFINSAIAAGLYRQVRVEYHNSFLLNVWVWLLTAIGLVTIILVNCIYLRNIFFIGRSAEEKGHGRLPFAVVSTV